jgi:hypothetical protein
MSAILAFHLQIKEGILTLMHSFGRKFVAAMGVLLGAQQIREDIRPLIIKEHAVRLLQLNENRT